jgi:hypothetical protein
VIRNLAPQLGFRVLENWSSRHCFSQMLLERCQATSEIDPLATLKIDPAG